MKAVVESQQSDRNAPRPKTLCRTLPLRTSNLRRQTYEIERMARDGGEGTRARLNDSLRKAGAIFDEVLKREGRFVRAMESQHSAPRDQRLDVVA